MRRVALPREIVLPMQISDSSEIETLINEQRSDKTSEPLKITLGSSSPENTQLIKLAQENAQSLLKDEESKDEVRKRERLRALKDLKEKFDLGKIPRRIECYDISNLQGNEAVGAMTVFIEGFPDKSQYQKVQDKDRESNRRLFNDGRDVEQALQAAERNFNLCEREEAIGAVG